MKTAVLIIAHNDFPHLKRLVSVIGNKNIDIFIHVDKKWTGFTESMEKDIEQSTLSDVCFLEQRFSGQLDNWMLVHITLALLKKAYEKRRGYQYYALISGNDYPLMNSNDMCDILKKMYPAVIMDCVPYDKENWIYHKFRYYYNWKLQSILYNLKINRYIYKVLRTVNNRIDRVRTMLTKSPYQYLSEANVKLYGGSAWWILPDIAVKYVFDFIDSNNTIYKLLQHSRTPEETFFQTVIMTSPLNSSVELNSVDERLQNCKTYAYFTDSYGENAKKPFTGHPYFFNINDRDFVDQLISSKKWFFGRKFSEAKDKAILDYIDSKLSEIS